jgi:putative DNA methylase
LADSSGGYVQAVEWVARVIEHTLLATAAAPAPTVIRDSAINAVDGQFDQIVTDPPYYDAIPYSDLMDFFHVWLRRTLYGLTGAFDAAFADELGPKWSEEQSDGELVDQPGRFNNDTAKSKASYEAGMATVFQRCFKALADSGRLVVVFANKNPDAWEALVSALVRAGFTVDASWPIQTERAARTNALTSATLASSIWLVCRKRDVTTRAGWDTDVLKEMEVNITQSLRDFWDAGVRGPDFVWAATGPALEAFSRYPAVKKATEPGVLLSVAEFLGHVRRMVVDFVVGRVLLGGESTNPAVGEHTLDDITTYYLLHRHDFGLKDASAGACILYAVSCGLSERLLTDQHDILLRGAPSSFEEDAEESDDSTAEFEGQNMTGPLGGQFRLKSWSQRKGRNLGVDTGNGRPVPLIDQVHKVMHLWKAGDEIKVNDYLESRGLRRSALFDKLVQALIEKSRHENLPEECIILEKIANHLRKIGATSNLPLSLGT